MTGKVTGAWSLAGAPWPCQTAAMVLGELYGARVNKKKLRQITVGMRQ